MFTKRVFTQRFGDPASFLFKGQVWDTHLPDASPGDKNCAICRRHLRFVFILKETQTSDPTAPPEVAKLEVGRCCFHYFRRWNLPLFWELFYALQYELNREIAIKHDKKVFGDWAGVKIRVKFWKSLKQQALVLLKKLQVSNTLAPAGSLDQLAQAISRHPLAYKRIPPAIIWYDKQIKELQEKIKEISEY